MQTHKCVHACIVYAYVHTCLHTYVRTCICTLCIYSEGVQIGEKKKHHEKNDKKHNNSRNGRSRTTIRRSRCKSIIMRKEEGEDKESSAKEKEKVCSNNRKTKRRRGQGQSGSFCLFALGLQRARRQSNVASAHARNSTAELDAAKDQPSTLEDVVKVTQKESLISLSNYPGGVGPLLDVELSMLRNETDFSINTD